MATEFLRFRTETIPAVKRIYLDMDNWPSELLLSDFLLVELDDGVMQVHPAVGVVQFRVENGTARYRIGERVRGLFVTTLHLEEGRLWGREDGGAQHQDEVTYDHVRPADAE